MMNHTVSGTYQPSMYERRYVFGVYLVFVNSTSICTYIHTDILYVRVKAPRHVCTENTVRGGVSRG